MDMRGKMLLSSFPHYSLARHLLLEKLTFKKGLSE